MKYLALVLLVSSLFAGSASAHMYGCGGMVCNDTVVPMYHRSGPIFVPGPSAPKVIFFHRGDAV